MELLSKVDAAAQAIEEQGARAALDHQTCIEQLSTLQIAYDGLTSKYQLRSVDHESELLRVHTVADAMSQEAMQLKATLEEINTEITALRAERV